MRSGSCGKQSGGQPAGEREDAGMCNIRVVFRGDVPISDDVLPCSY